MTTIDAPDLRIVAVFLRGHLKLISKGLTPRGRKGDYLKKATEITGKPYKRGDYAKAADDLKLWLEGTL